MGKEFSVADVEALSPSGERRDSVLGALDALGRKELVRHSGARSEREETFSFRHMLIRDTAYEGIPKFERADLHERYADWLESRAGGRIEDRRRSSVTTWRSPTRIGSRSAFRPIRSKRSDIEQGACSPRPGHGRRHEATPPQP